MAAYAVRIVIAMERYVKNATSVKSVAIANVVRKASAPVRYVITVKSA